MCSEYFRENASKLFPGGVLGQILCKDGKPVACSFVYDIVFEISFWEKMRPEEFRAYEMWRKPYRNRPRFDLLDIWPVRDVNDCVSKHEKKHVLQAKDYPFDVCENVCDGQPANMPRGDLHNKSECEAYGEFIDCLKNRIYRNDDRQLKRRKVELIKNEIERVNNEFRCKEYGMTLQLGLVEE
jgi:hypothetical protein